MMIFRHQIGCRRFRLVLLALVVTGLAPGLIWREAAPRIPVSPTAEVRFTPLPAARGRLGGPGAPELVGAWRLTSRDPRFDSYSALVALTPGELLSFSDRGQYIRFAVPPPEHQAVRMGEAFPGLNEDKSSMDIESATRDPATGRIWLGLEGRNAIMRLGPDLVRQATYAPPEMARWPVNSGAESLTRLPDGRFLVLSEALGGPHGDESEGLLFPGDPTQGSHAMRFRMKVPKGLYPSDIALLPDGRALILLRGIDWHWFPSFIVKLVLADPAEIRAGELWQWRPVADLDKPAPRENYEGLAVTGGANGAPVTLWLVSDDNSSVLVQRSLLLELRWQVPEK